MLVSSQDYPKTWIGLKSTIETNLPEADNDQANAAVDFAAGKLLRRASADLVRSNICFNDERAQAEHR
jgi:hypothetical protein